MTSGQIVDKMDTQKLLNAPLYSLRRGRAAHTCQARHRGGGGRDDFLAAQRALATGAAFCGTVCAPFCSRSRSILFLARNCSNQRRIVLAFLGPGKHSCLDHFLLKQKFPMWIKLVFNPDAPKQAPYCFTRGPRLLLETKGSGVI